MDWVEAALNFASIVNFVALLLLLRTILKHRNMLRGFSISGSLLTFISLCGFEVAYYLLGNWVSTILGFAGVIFWFLAFIYSLRIKIEKAQRDKERQIKQQESEK